MPKIDDTRIAVLAEKIVDMENPVIMTDEFWKDIQMVVASHLPVKNIEQTALPDSTSMWQFKSEPEIMPQAKNFWTSIFKAWGRSRVPK